MHRLASHCCSLTKSTCMSEGEDSDQNPLKTSACMRESRKFCERGSNFDVFSVDEGCEDPITTISGRLSARQRNAIEMAFHWRADDGPTLNISSVASSLFRGSGLD